MDLVTLQTVVGLLSALVALAAVVFQLINATSDKKKATRAEAIIKASNIPQDDKQHIDGILRQHRRLTLALVAIIIGVAVGAFLLVRTGSRGQELERALREQAPRVFDTSSDKSPLCIVRALPREALMPNSDLSQVLAETKTSFDLFAFNGYRILENYKPSIEAAVKRGVKLRFVFLDSTQDNADPKKNNPGFPAMADHVRESAAALKANAAYATDHLAAIAALIRTAGATYTGSIEVKHVKGLMPYSGWIRDGDSDAAVAQVGIYGYRESSTWLYFKGDKEHAAALVRSTKDDFQELWNRP